jgi:BirA family biotin operon repressor/biotin-[acetyl-CoA-carboxylase] ligase
LTDWPAGYRLIRHRKIDSTNSEARRLAETGEAGPLWIIGLIQTAGRGRRGRAWDSAVGNLAATLLIRPARQSFGQLSFVTALAVADMTAQQAPGATVSVKWPNDVLVNGGKIAGILLESGLDATGAWLAVGVGVNLAGHPENMEFPATSLAALGVVPPSPDQALTLLAARFAHWYDRWMGEGFEPLRSAWLARAEGLGAPIRARLPREEHRGVFAGIDAGGALLLDQQGQIRTIAAAEVFF